LLSKKEKFKSVPPSCIGVKDKKFGHSAKGYEIGCKGRHGTPQLKGHHPHLLPMLGTIDSLQKYFVKVQKS
jgi:hypothetical protein